MPDKLKTTEPMILAENLEITDEREAEIERLRAIIGDLLAAAKEVLPLTRLIELPTPSMKNVFSELRAAIAAAEEQAL